MITFVIVVAVLLLAFLFFSHPAKNLPSPTADIETRMGRTTLYHYRAKVRHGKGAIVMVHGFSENQLYFQCVAEPLTRAGYDCIAINLFGYNGSLPNQPDSYTVEAYSQQIREALLEFKRLRTVKSLVAVWGHSMGGAAVYLASSDIVRQHPEVKGVFLENPGFGNNLTVLSRLLRPFAVLSSFRGPRLKFQFFTNLLFTRALKDPGAKQFMKRILINYAPEKAVAVANLKSISRLTFGPDTISDNATKKMFFVFSKRDKLISFKKVERNLIAKLQQDHRFSEAHRLILPDADHFVSLQAPEKIAEFVLGQLHEKESQVFSEAAD